VSDERVHPSNPANPDGAVPPEGAATSGASSWAEPQGATPARRRGRGSVVAVLLVAAGVTALTAVPTWLTASATTALEGAVAVAATGSQVAPGVLAAAVVLLAAAAATALVGRAGRWLVAAVVAAAGALVVVAAAGVLADPAGAARPVVLAQTGVGGATSVAVGAGPWCALVVGVLDVLLAVWFLRATRGWGLTTGHEQPAAEPAPRRGEPDERDDWDALSRGDDPS
jgi:uncharacterized membrane protein (TIGR02234 family)